MSFSGTANPFAAFYTVPIIYCKQQFKQSSQIFAAAPTTGILSGQNGMEIFSIQFRRASV
jgi:hypothetical protein